MRDGLSLQNGGRSLSCFPAISPSLACLFSTSCFSARVASEATGNAIWGWKNPRDI